MNKVLSWLLDTRRTSVSLPTSEHLLRVDGSLYRSTCRCFAVQTLTIRQPEHSTGHGLPRPRFLFVQWIKTASCATVVRGRNVGELLHCTAIRYSSHLALPPWFLTRRPSPAPILCLSPVSPLLFLLRLGSAFWRTHPTQCECQVEKNTPLGLYRDNPSPCV